MLFPVRCCMRISSLALLYYPSHAMSYLSSSKQAGANCTVSTVNAEQGTGAGRTEPRRRIANKDVIFKHLGIRTLHSAAASCNFKKKYTSEQAGESTSELSVACLSGSNNNFPATNTLEQAGESKSELLVTCSEQPDPERDCFSLSTNPSTSSLSEHQFTGTAQTDQLSEESLHIDDEFLHETGCSDLLEEYSLPTSFGKQQSSQNSQSRYPKSKENSVRHVSGSRDKKPKSHVRCIRVERFDICQSEAEVIEGNCSATDNVTFLRSSQDVENAADELEENLPIEEPIHEVLRPGMVLLKKYLSPTEQVSIVQQCRKLGLGPGGFYRPGYKDGAKLRLQMMCLGLDWDPQTRKYQKRRRIDRAKPPNIPHEFHLLVNRAMEDSLSRVRDRFRICNAEKILPNMSPDVCIVNFYTETGRLGLHQDRDESAESLSKGLPVVSFSVGNSAEFLYGDHRDVNRAEKVVLDSGDVLVFGGDSRHVFHGISSIIPDSAPEFLLEETRLRPGRLNLTFRQY